MRAWISFSRFGLPAALAALEASLLLPWLRALGIVLGGGGPLLGWGTLFVILLVGQLATAAGLSSSWPERRLRLGLALSGVLVALPAGAVAGRGLLSPASRQALAQLARHPAMSSPLPELGPLLAAAVVALLLWWRAIALARRRRESEEVMNVLRWGLAALVVLQLGALAGGEPLASILTAQVGFYLLVALFFGLAAMGLCAVYNTEARARRDGASLVQRHWLGVVFGAISGILLLTLFLSQLLSLDLLRSIAANLRPLGELLIWVLILAAFAAGLLVAALVYVLRWVIGGGHPVQPFSPPQFEDFSRLQQGPLRTLPPEVTIALNWGAAVLVAVLLLALLASAVRRFVENEGDEVEEERESVWSRDELVAALRSWWAGLRRRRRAEPPVIVQPGLFDLLAGSPGAVRSVREAYRRLLAEGQARGLPRRGPETPAEYAQRVPPAFGGAVEPVGTLTKLYQQVRYGETSADDDVARARICLEEIVTRRSAEKAQGSA